MLNISASKVVLVLPHVAKSYCSRGFKSSIAYQPHITLAMGVIDYSNFDRVRKVMRLVARQFSHIDCHIVSRDSSDFYNMGEPMTYYSLTLNKKLRQLHQSTMKEINSYRVDNFGMANFFDDIPADDATLNMMRQYPSEHAYRRRQPMIELGYSDLNAQKRQFHFFSQKIALWKIGYRGRLTKEMYFVRMGGKA